LASEVCFNASSITRFASAANLACFCFQFHALLEACYAARHLFRFYSEANLAFTPSGLGLFATSQLPSASALALVVGCYSVLTTLFYCFSIRSLLCVMQFGFLNISCLFKCFQHQLSLCIAVLSHLREFLQV
jgi:hypothetical protein